MSSSGGGHVANSCTPDIPHYPMRACSSAVWFVPFVKLTSSIISKLNMDFLFDSILGL